MNRIQDQAPFAPLGLDVWHPDNFGLALNIVNSQMERFDEIGKSHCRELGFAALAGSLTNQTIQNGGLTQKHENGWVIAAQGIEALELDDEDQEFRVRMGLCQPAESTRIFRQNPSLQSMEIARLTHVADWQTTEAIDAPVRNELFESADLETESLYTGSYYKIGAIGTRGRSFEGVGISRKRAVASHFGGKVLSMVVNNILVDLTDRQPQTSEFRAELRKALHDPARTKHTRYSDIGGLETFMRTRDAAEKPSALIPLSTIYYLTRPEARRDSE